MPVRALYGVTRANASLGGFDTMNTKLYYPALSFNASASYRPTFPADPSGAPYPVVIFMNGADCTLEVYQWLAIRLVLEGLLVLMYNWIQPVDWSSLGISPGINTVAYNYSTFGTTPMSTSLPPLFETLDTLNSKGVLKGLIDTNTVIVGGHSYGGLVALNSGNEKFFTRVKGVFSYGAHTGSIPETPPGVCAPLPSKLPYLIIGGDRDGVIATGEASLGKNWSDPAEPLRCTWETALTGGSNNQYLLLLQGANHFAIAHPQDDTASSGYVDFPATSPPSYIRIFMSRAIRLFISGEVRNSAAARAILESWLSSPPSYTLQFSRK